MEDNNEKIKIQKNKKEVKKDSLKDTIIDWIKTILTALVIALVLKLFIVDATRVSGKSMLNTLHHDDMLLVNKIGKHFTSYKRGQIIILDAPDYPNRLYVKRVVGIPGDTISLKDDKVYLNGEELQEPYTSVDYTLPGFDGVEWQLSENEYFVMGDNRLEGASNDSRNFGPITKDDIVGHAFFRIYPFSDFGLIDNNPYGEKTN